MTEPRARVNARAKRGGRKAGEPQEGWVPDLSARPGTRQDGTGIA